MRATAGWRRPGARPPLGPLLLALATSVAFSACAAIQRDGGNERIEETLRLAAAVKAFGRTVGIEPTEALGRGVSDGPAVTMLWMWLQRAGTLAIRQPIDIRMAVGFYADGRVLNVERVYRVNGYSVYYRYGNEFADPRSVATAGFAESSAAHRVRVILHEDLHGDRNFDFDWEIEEGIVTPLAALAAVDFFRRRGDAENARLARAMLERERALSHDLTALVREVEPLLDGQAAETTKRRILAALAAFPDYHRQFKRQLDGQHPPTALEAKLSHDLAYYRYYEQIVSLYERAGLEALIAAFKGLPRDSGRTAVEERLALLRMAHRVPVR